MTFLKIINEIFSDTGEKQKYVKFLLMLRNVKFVSATKDTERLAS